MQDIDVKSITKSLEIYSYRRCENHKWIGFNQKHTLSLCRQAASKAGRELILDVS